MENEKKSKGIGLLTTLLLMGFVPLAVGAIAMTLVSSINLKNEIKSETFKKLQVAAESVNQYFMYDVVANGDVDYSEYEDHTFIESAQSEEVEMTLFKDNVRFLTSLKNADGTYNEGTEAGAEVYKAVKAGSDFSADDIVINGKVYYVYYKPIYDVNGNFWGMAFAGTPDETVRTAINKSILSLIGFAVIVALVCTVVIAILAIRIKKTIASAADCMAKLADGDISEGTEVKSSITEISEMLGAANTLQSKLSEVIGTVKEHTDYLSDSIENVHVAAKESSDGTNQISMAMDELASSTMTLTENVQSVSADAGSMGDHIQGITENVKALSEASGEIKRSTENAQNYMNKVMDSSSQSTDATREIQESINLTNESIVKITQSVNVIAEIASQTSLLSLNASIEAARAGESGRGFAVVAEEIGKLATESANSAETIRKLAEDMNEKSSHTVELADKIGHIIEDERNCVVTTQSAFESLGASIEESLAMISEIDSKTEELDKLKDGILNSICDLSAISEENAASNEEVTASVSNIAGRVTDMSGQSDNMKALSDELMNAVAYFK